MKNPRWALSLAATGVAATLLLTGCGGDPASEEAQDTVAGYTFGDNGEKTPASVQPYEPCSRPGGDWTPKQVATARTIRDTWSRERLAPRFMTAALLVSHDRTQLGEAGQGDAGREARVFFAKARTVPNGAYIPYTELVRRTINQELVDPEGKVLRLSTFMVNC